jgi:hypothetical protein
MSLTPLRRLFAIWPLIASLQGILPAQAPQVSRILWGVGFRILEVPLNSAQPLKSIALLLEPVPDALITVGIVLRTWLRLLRRDRTALASIHRLISQERIFPPSNIMLFI